MIYIFFKGPFPHGMAATQRVICYAKGLIAAGADVEVIIPCRTERAEVRNDNLSGFYEGVPFRYLPPSNICRGFRKLFMIGDFPDNLLYFWPFCLKVVRKTDKVFFYNLERQKFAIRIFLWRGIKTIYDICEYPDYGRDNLLFKYFKWTAFHIWYPKFDAFVAISENLFELAKQYKKKDAKVIKVPTMFDSSLLDKPFSSKDGLKVPYIFHAGTITERKDGIISTMKAYIMSSQKIDEPLYFYIAGKESAECKELRLMLKEAGFEDRVFFLGLINQEEVDKYQEGAYLSILNRNVTNQNLYGFSTKLSSMLIHGTPVIATKVGEINNWLEDGISGYMVEPHRPELIAEKIIEAVENPERNHKIGLAGQKVALENFNNIIQGQRLKAFIDEV